MAVLLLVAGLSELNALGPAIAVAAGEMKGIALRVLLLQMTNLLLTAFFVMFLQLGALGSAFATLAATVIVEVGLYWPFCRKVAAVPDAAVGIRGCGTRSRSRDGFSRLLSLL